MFDNTKKEGKVQIINLTRDSCRILGLRLCSMLKEHLILLPEESQKMIEVAYYVHKISTLIKPEDKHIIVYRMSMNETMQHSP